MVSFFSPKHQKLVNQCYPTGRASDKKPKSSETSYLLYYVNSRRTKLEKVSAYLDKRTTNDLNHRRIGNVMVTLELVDKIVVSCKENLNVFVKEFLNIMIKTLNNNSFNIDESIVEKIETAFGSICRHLDGVLCNGDSEFIQMYQSFVNIYFQIVMERMRNDDLLMKGCLDISKASCLAGNLQVGQLMGQGVELSLSKFQGCRPRFQGESLEVELNPNEKRLSRSQTHVTGLDEIQNSNDYSEKALFSYFNTTEMDKLTISINALIKKLLVVPNKELLQYISNGIPVQLRYIVILLLTRELQIGDKNSVILLKLMTSLLVSEVSIIGLSVLDFMRKITTFQLSNAEYPAIVDACTDTICALNRKSYYKDQSLDMVSELLLKFKDNSLEHQKDIFINDLNAILKTATLPFMNLNIFLEVAPYNKDNLELFNLVTDNIPSGFVMNQFFNYLVELESKSEQKALVDAAFGKFKQFALFYGLICFLQQVSSYNDVYYMYHMRAARFLKLDDYYKEAKVKMHTRSFFTRKELANYYSHLECHKYSEKGLRILRLKTDHLSTTELVAETPLDIEANYDRIIPTTPPNSKTQAKLIANSDISINSLEKLKKPKVSDLVRAAKGTKLTVSHGSLRASQSVKSCVTNITFLLNELNNEGERTTIYDPDSEEIKFFKNRSKFSSNSNFKVNKAAHTQNDNSRDTFLNASNHVELQNTYRGRLFLP